jgi:hypothetical protein
MDVEGEDCFATWLGDAEAAEARRYAGNTYSLTAMTFNTTRLT